MKILFVAPEVVPFVRTGGLADVAGALPRAIGKIGHDIRVFMPRYKCVDANQDFPLKIYFFESKHFKSRGELYRLNGKDYPDNYEAFLGFCRGVLPLIEEIGWKPDIIHCNDWQTGPVCLYARSLQRTAIVYSVHNMANQGYFPDKEIENFAQVGIENAHVINTVSEKYAKEIQTKEYGCGLEGLLKERTQDIYGILNGLDLDVWNPTTDKRIVKHYNRMTVSLKTLNKTNLQKALGLPVEAGIPLIGLISRLDAQKGFDILAEVITEILQLNCQVVVLGTGDPHYQDLLEEMKEKYPARIGLKLGFDDTLAHKIYAGSDIFLMPSKFEPCGQGQLISFKYGTIPLVRKTGGLADTVHIGVDGFVFEKYSSAALLAAVKEAIEAYKNKAAWAKLQQKVMSYDYSWHNSATRYISLYMKALAKIGIGVM